MIIDWFYRSSTEKTSPVLHLLLCILNLVALKIFLDIYSQPYVGVYSTRKDVVLLVSVFRFPFLFLSFFFLLMAKTASCCCLSVCFRVTFYNFRVSEFQVHKISEFQNFWISNLMYVCDAREYWLELSSLVDLVHYSLISTGKLKPAGLLQIEYEKKFWYFLLKHWIHALHHLAMETPLGHALAVSYSQP